MNTITLEQADDIANVAIATCKKNHFNDITVTIVNGYGQTIVTKKMDNCMTIETPNFAYAKAYTCVAVGNSSRGFRDKYTTKANNDIKKYCQMLSMNTISNGKLAPFPGGVLIKNENDNTILGAVGISGAAADEDEYCALLGVWETLPNCSTVPDAHSCTTLKE